MFDPASLALTLGPNLCLVPLLVVGAIRSSGTFRIMLWVSLGCSLISLIVDVIVRFMLGTWDLPTIGWISTIGGFFGLAGWVLVLLVIILTRPGVRNDPPSGWSNPNPFGY